MSKVSENLVPNPVGVDFLSAKVNSFWTFGGGNELISVEKLSTQEVPHPEKAFFNYAINNDEICFDKAEKIALHYQNNIFVLLNQNVIEFFLIKQCINDLIRECIIH